MLLHCWFNYKIRWSSQFLGSSLGWISCLVAGGGCICCAHLFGWSLRLGMLCNSPCEVDFIFLFMVLYPTDSRATTSCCSQRNSWKLHIHLRRRLSAFRDLSLRLTCCCCCSLTVVLWRNRGKRALPGLSTWSTCMISYIRNRVSRKTLMCPFRFW